MRFRSFLTGLAFLWFTMHPVVLGDTAKDSDVATKVKKLIHTLCTSKEAGRRDRAAQELGMIGAPAIAPLSEVLRDPKVENRTIAAWTFGRMEQPVVAKAVPVLLEAIRREKDEAALEELAKVIPHAGEPAVPGLINLVQTTTGDVRKAAFYSLGRLRGVAKAAVPDMIKLLTEKDNEARGGAVYVLGRIGPDARDAVPALIKLMGASREARVPVIYALASIGEASDDVLKVVLKALKEPDPKLRTAAVRACAAFGPKAKSAVPDLIRLLEDDKVNVADVYPRPVVEALGRVGPEAKAAGPKLVALLKDPDIEHATHAAAALLRIGIEEKAAVAVFNRALDSSLRGEKQYIRNRTFELIETMGPAAKPIVPLLISIVKNEKEDREIRFQAIRILRQLDPRAVEKSGITCPSTSAERVSWTGTWVALQKLQLFGSEAVGGGNEAALDGAGPNHFLVLRNLLDFALLRIDD
jgi:HEAT repeat protein